MLFVRFQFRPDVVWSTHTESALPELLRLDPAVYGICRTEDAVRPFGPLPSNFEVVERTETSA